MSIQKFVPEIQEQLRHQGFPKFLQGQIQEILLQPNAVPKASALDRYEFQNKDGTTGIILTSSWLAVQTNSYRRFEDFEKIVETALVVVDGVVDLTLVERIGLRYVDLIRLGEKETWADYLQSGLLGIEPKSIGITEWTTNFQAIGATELGKLIIRCSQLQHWLPPDLFPTTLRYSVNLRPGETVSLLDFDHFTEESTDFSGTSVLATIGELHDQIDRAFRNAVTRQALEKWGNQENP
jgi:uncharacterized protein (TIGR04255 family)